MANVVVGEEDKVILPYRYLFHTAEKMGKICWFVVIKLSLHSTKV